ncbi:MAG: hypothetical protein KIC46_10020, partial [Clostridiales bacterium]|nr:hypothetical protein [Clostridiales bacterium]
LHGTSAAERLRHVETRSANLPKLNASRRFKHMGRIVFAPAVRGRGQKSPHEPRRSSLRALPRPPESYLGRNQFST